MRFIHRIPHLPWRDHSGRQNEQESVLENPGITEDTE